MTHDEIKQLSAYSQYDGFYLAILWVASFVCLLYTTYVPFLGQVYTILLFSTPFFVAYRFKKFREEGRNGIISFRRGLFYCLRVHFNAALIFSLLQWLYMNYVDNGRLLAVFTTIYSTPEAKQMYSQLNVSYNDVIRLLSMMTEPTVLAANSFITAVLSGVVFSLIIAALMMKQVRTSNSKQY